LIVEKTGKVCEKRQKKNLSRERQGQGMTVKQGWQDQAKPPRKKKVSVGGHKDALPGESLGWEKGKEGTIKVGPEPAQES